MSLFNNKYRIETTRLQNWNYAWNSKYFVTIVTKNHKHFFGKITDKQMHFSKIGIIAFEYWNDIPKHFPFVTLDEFCIMPNHIHGIIVIDNKTGNTHTLRDVACNVSTNESNSNKMSVISPKPCSLSTIIRSFKSAVTKFANENNYIFGWQSRFYEHIIRNERSLNRIRNYIRNNPLNWKNDKFNLRGTL